GLRAPVGVPHPAAAAHRVARRRPRRDRGIPAARVEPMRRGYTIYNTLAFLARHLFRLVGRLDVHGLENVPSSGPFLLLANHESILDPILIQAVCPRPVHTMAKSTQFASPFMGWMMRAVKSFPVRRYQVDP